MKEAPLDANVSFRAPRQILDDIEAYRRRRRLHKVADAARELMASALEEPELHQAALELRRLGGDPMAALRNALAELERDTTLREIGTKVALVAPAPRSENSDT